ncbi:ABC-2 transporter permease [Gorillibacterium sp. sgz5001074]|uniref:ABC-2 transporter permease n=1 Tax=Gorillibacterium sp. sgz5001074 TaxID=3446695 RepID=UPI003F67E042
MLPLIWKDFLLQKRTAYLYVGIGALFFFYLDAMDQRNMMAAMIPAFMIVYSFMNRSMAEDDRNHSLRLLVSMPLPRATLVRAKYASIGIVALLSLAVFLTAGVLAGAYSFRDPEERVLNLLILAVFTLVCTVLVSVFLPLSFKLGAVRAQTINRFVFIGMFMLGATFGTIITKLGNRLIPEGEPPAWIADLERLGDTFSGWSPYIGILALFLLALLIYAASMQLSIRYFRRRELF